MLQDCCKMVLAAATIALRTPRHVILIIKIETNRRLLSSTLTIYVYIYFEGFRVYRLSLFSLINPTINGSVPVPAQRHSLDLQLADTAQQTMPSMNANPFLVELA